MSCIIISYYDDDDEYYFPVFLSAVDFLLKMDFVMLVLFLLF